jgi:hypothetical protein
MVREFKEILLIKSNSKLPLSKARLESKYFLFAFNDTQFMACSMASKKRLLLAAAFLSVYGLPLRVCNILVRLRRNIYQQVLA